MRLPWDSGRSRQRAAPRGALLALALPIVLALALGACERLPAPGGAPGAASGGNRPFPELERIAEVVAETRAILPRIPADATPPPLAPAAASAPTARLALVGEGRLLRPAAFPHLPQRVGVELYLDAREPPGGRLRVTDESGSADWPILDAYGSGRRADAFAYVFRVRDPEARLRYFALLGVPFETGERRYRSFEGYLIHPATGGKLSAEGAIYPVDFGYRQPEPPPPLAAGQALAERLQSLRGQFTQWEAQGARIAGLQTAAQRLGETRVPSLQAQRQREDLRDFSARIAAAQAERDQAATALREALLGAYQQRAALAEAWSEFTQTNGYRWRSPAERRTAYLPLQSLRAAYPALERIYTALQGDDDAALRASRQEMERAVLREQEQTPVGE